MGLKLNVCIDKMLRIAREKRTSISAHEVVFNSGLSEIYVKKRLHA